MLGQRRRRWADVVQMLCKCFVFARYIYDLNYKVSSSSIQSTVCNTQMSDKIYNILYDIERYTDLNQGI